jgi:hypothetical protein
MFGSKHSPDFHGPEILARCFSEEQTVGKKEAAYALRIFVLFTGKVLTL